MEILQLSKSHAKDVFIATQSAEFRNLPPQTQDQWFQSYIKHEIEGLAKMGYDLKLVDVVDLTKPYVFLTKP